MPAAPVYKVPGGSWLFLAGLMAGLAYWLSQQPYLVGVLVAVIVSLGGIVWIEMVRDMRRLRRLAASRQEESICQFARSFDRHTDTWLIRAVYEELSRYLSVDGRPIPVRRQDRCKKDLGIDPEDLDDIGSDAAFRAGRSMDDCDKNPMYGKVQTVGDLVTFLAYQPRIVDADAAPDGRSTASIDNPDAPGGPPSVA